MTSIRITIATATYNAGTKLTQTRASLHKAIGNLEEVEHLIIDGKSNDGSIDQTRDNLARYERIYSEPDRGIYDAFNKALRLARGEYIMFVGAGDLFDMEGLNELIRLCAKGTADIIQGDIQQILPDGSLGKRRFPHFNRLWLRGSNLCHPSMAVRVLLYSGVGGFDETYSPSSDWLALLKIQDELGPSYHYTSRIVTLMLAGGISSNVDIKLGRKIVSAQRGGGRGAIFTLYNQILMIGGRLKKGINR